MNFLSVPYVIEHLICFLRLIRENPRVSDLASLSVHVVNGSSLLKSAWVGLSILQFWGEPWGLGAGSLTRASGTGWEVESETARIP